MQNDKQRSLAIAPDLAPFFEGLLSVSLFKKILCREPCHLQLSLAAAAPCCSRIDGGVDQVIRQLLTPSKVDNFIACLFSLCLVLS